MVILEFEKSYLIMACGRKVIKVDVTFDVETRTISSWLTAY